MHCCAIAIGNQALVVLFSSGAQNNLIHRKLNDPFCQAITPLQFSPLQSLFLCFCFVQFFLFSNEIIPKVKFIQKHFRLNCLFLHNNDNKKNITMQKN